MERLAGEALERFRACFDTEFWSTIPAIDGRHALRDAGFMLAPVSALELQHESTRLNNLRTRGFPIERVVATGSAESSESP